MINHWGGNDSKFVLSVFIRTLWHLYLVSRQGVMLRGIINKLGKVRRNVEEKIKHFNYFLSLLVLVLQGKASMIYGYCYSLTYLSTISRANVTLEQFSSTQGLKFMSRSPTRIIDESENAIIIPDNWNFPPSFTISGKFARKHNKILLINLLIYGFQGLSLFRNKIFQKSYFSVSNKHSLGSQKEGKIMTHRNICRLFMCASK